MESHELSRPQVLSLAVIELAVHVMLFDSVSAQWPLVVQENWQERMDQIILRLQQETNELQQFGEAFDEEE